MKMQSLLLIAAAAAAAGLTFAAPVPELRTLAGCGTAAIAKTDLSSRAKLRDVGECLEKAKEDAAAAEAARRDRLAALQLGYRPTPTTTTSLAGLSAISSGIKVADFLEPREPGAVDGDAVGAFRMVCEPSHISWDDPIVYPGRPGLSHLHQFFGNTLADANSSYLSLRTTGDSSCNNRLNRSAYWIPAMMNGRGKVVLPNIMTVYYKRRPQSDPECREAGRACLPLPRGLRYIFGFNMMTGKASDYWWNCDGPGATPGIYRSIADAAQHCPAGAMIGMVLVAPDCWNGKQLDSADHRSHLAYHRLEGSRMRCPASHPHVIPQFTLQVWWVTDSTLDRSGNEDPNLTSWYLSSDRMPGMAARVPGTTAHADWFGAWEDTIIARWTAGCIDGHVSCHSGNLGDGWGLRGDRGYHWNTTQTLLADVPAHPKT